MNQPNGFWSLLKAFFTKACFTVGLCTTAYWSVAKIHQSMNPSKAEASASNESGSLRDKVEHLADQNSFGALPSARSMHPSRNHIHRTETLAAAAPAASPTATPSESPATAAAEGSPSPAPAGDAQLQAQEGNPGQYPVADPLYPNPYAYHQAMMEMAREEAARAVASKGGAPTSGATAQALGQPTTGQLILPPKGPVYGGVNLAAGGNTTNVTSNLNSQDLQRLVYTSIKASVPNVEMTVSARKSDGSVDAAAKVWSNRWSIDRGIKAGASITPRANSEGYQIQFDVGFTLETPNNTEMPVQFNFKPTSSNAKNDVIGGANGTASQKVRIYTFTGPDLGILGNTSNSEQLQGITLVLKYDIDSAIPVFIGGTLSFHRSNVKTAASTWSVTPVQSADELVVESLPLSITLEKSP